MRPLDLLAMATAILIWSFSFSIVKIGVGQLPPLLMTAMRFTIVATLLSPFLIIQRGRMGQLFLLSITLGSLHFSLMFTGMKGVDAGPAAIAVQLFVPFSLLLAWIFFRETLRPVQIAAVAFAFVGVYYLSGEPRIAPRPLSLLLIVGSAFMMAVATMQIKYLGAIRIFSLNAWVALFAAPQIYLASWLIEDGQTAALAEADWRGWGALVYMAVGGTIIAHGLWYYLIGRYPVRRVVPMTLLSTALAVFIAAWILDEPLTVRILVGGAITIAAVAILQLYPRRPVKPGKAP